MSKRRYMLLWLACLGLIPALASAASLEDFARIRSDPNLKSQAQAIVDAAVQQAFGMKSQAPSSLDPIFQGPRAVFVTFQSKDGVRGCMGTLQPRQASLQEEIAKQVAMALFHDPWHTRIQRDELAGMQVFITAVGMPSPVRSISQISPGRDGAYLRSGGKEAVVLPGEAKTQRYLLAFLKAKAGWRKGEAFQLYRLPVETLELKIDFPGSSHGNGFISVPSFPRRREGGFTFEVQHLLRENLSRGSIGKAFSWGMIVGCYPGIQRSQREFS